MADKSGEWVARLLDLMGWKPTMVVQVGIGETFPEVQQLTDWCGSGLIFIGFEPNPQVGIGYPGVIIRCAAGSCEGIATLYVKPWHLNGSSMYPPNHGTEACETVEVDVKPIDSQVEVDPSEDVLLWLDCEGSELDALLGAAKLLECVNAINCEVTEQPPGNWSSPNEIDEFMRERDFHQYARHTYRRSSGAGQCDILYVKGHLFTRTLGAISE